MFEKNLTQNNVEKKPELVVSNNEAESLEKRDRDIRMEQEAIKGFLVNILKSKTLYDALEEKKISCSLNLFGKQISADKELYSRIGRPGKLTLWVNEEYIPRQDEKGDWIEQPRLDGVHPNTDSAEPSVDIIPAGLTREEFVSRLKEQLLKDLTVCEREGQNPKHVKTGLDEEVVNKIMTEILYS